MQRFFVLFALCLLASFTVAQDHDGFIGVWVDNFGETVKLCITEGQTRLEGTYNQFGLIQADLSDFSETANGKFYDTYYQTDDECPRGDFTWHVNGNTITGHYSCFDGLEGGDWVLNRVIPQETPSHAECNVLSDSADDDDIEGAWNLDGNIEDDDDWNICLDGEQFTASHGEPGTVGSTYQFGRVFENGRILSGSYITVLDNYGNIGLGGTTIFLSEKTALSSFNWVSPNSVSQVIQAPPGSFFSISDVDKIGDTTSALCNRNSFLAVGYYDDDDFVPVFKSSPASVLSVSVAFVFAVVIAALAI
eukprot:CAMPEP_0117033774 /NCGR_PEP_ID=MMETSP0472-20121206/24107_1 /TAXON_ID=693140 ORGANISM="Tiarina fusus, Strain LIS" /NCGR_SAMPLE_ID=MMETSP0472 /ASSEMBLY_ACC=CAM_ASM_000603 /LENGTH=305 /DNA_ID=CAMNT_0004742785 /DNA_START=28 /DNA_END=945 /DNA_ORIENTATION=-